MAGAAAEQPELAKTALQLAPMVDVWRKLLAEHTPRRDGRCKVCRTAGGHGYQQWPCTLYAVANSARELHNSY